jgi:hypothetical protein
MFRAGSGETGAGMFIFTNLRGQLAVAEENLQNAGLGWSLHECSCKFRF